MWFSQYPELTIVPPAQGQTKRGVDAASLTFMFMSYTPRPSPQRFSFHKLADPRLVGSFTRMTSSAQTLPTVLNKARACFSVQSASAALRLL